MFDTNWNVDKYKYHYELDHQWNLKKKFILANKDKYPEDRLICLAQTFCNVYYMGCTYDEPIMELIGELSKGLAEKNEKWQKQSFVAASSAVEERVRDQIIGILQPHQTKPSQIKNLIHLVRKKNIISLNDSSGSSPDSSFDSFNSTDNPIEDLVKEKRNAEDGNEEEPQSKKKPEIEVIYISDDD